MTEYERVALEKIGNHFKREFASLVGDCLAQMPYPLQPETLAYIQELTNVYDTSDKHLEVKRVNWGTAPVAYKGTEIVWDDTQEDKVCLASVPEFLSL